MRGLGIALIIIGLLGSVLIFLYPCLGWSGLVGAEMCIRDRAMPGWRSTVWRPMRAAWRLSLTVTRSWGIRTTG